MTDSQEYRNQAELCIRMAESAANPQDRKTFSQLGAIWLRLANELDTNRALIEHWGIVSHNNEISPDLQKPSSVKIRRRVLDTLRSSRSRSGEPPAA